MIKSSRKRKRRGFNDNAKSHKLCYGGFLHSNVVVCGSETIRLQEEEKVIEDVKITPM